MTTLKGKVSWFGGPEDTGVSPSEGLAFYYDVSDAPDLFLSHQPAGTTGLARRLNPEKFYIACRWDYAVTPKTMLPDMKVKVTNPKTGASVLATPADWGPHSDTDRCADISQGMMVALGLTTDDQVIVEFQPLGETAMIYGKVVISSGHGLYVRGAHGILDEVDEARLVTNALAEALREREVEVEVFHDDVSKNQSENLNRIVSAHNAVADRDLDISVHFNAFEQTAGPRGVEVLYYSKAELAGSMSAAIACAAGFIDRGGKKRTDLYFLNNTNKPAILIEVCFVDSEADAQLYKASFDAIIDAIAGLLSGVDDIGEEIPPPDPPVVPVPRIDIEVSGEVLIYINGTQVGTKG
jgi:N-acetylmuramoyl-L-alanine amidase